MLQKRCLGDGIGRHARLKILWAERSVRVRFPPQVLIINMACHYLNCKNPQEFFGLIKQRDPDTVLKMVKCVLSAYKRGKDKIDIFEITFKDMSELTFSIDKPQYRDLLSNCMEDLIKMEEYELCGEIKKILDKKPRKSRKKKEKIEEAK